MINRIELRTATSKFAVPAVACASYRSLYERIEELLHRCPFGEVELSRWAELWTETVDELFVGDVAFLAKHRAGTAAGAIGSLVRRQASNATLTMVEPG